MKDKKTVAKIQTRMRPSEPDKDFVLRNCADLAEAGYGFVHELSNSVRHLYLFSGEVYRVGKSDLTRIK
jgi:hypothetical protein